MRFAQPPAPPGEDDVIESLLREPEAPMEGSSASVRPRSRWWLGVRVVLSLAALAVVGVFASVLQPPEEPAVTATITPAPPALSPSPAPPPRAPLAFVLTDVRATALEERSVKEQARAAAAQIQAILSGFFDAAFFDPESWQAGVPDPVWAMFAPDARGEARLDVASFSLGPRADQVIELAPIRATLAVEVLFDHRGRPLAAVAEFSIRGEGATEGGDPLTLQSDGVLLLEPASGGWLVVGYPEVATRVEAGPAGASVTAPTSLMGGAP